MPEDFRAEFDGSYLVPLPSARGVLLSCTHRMALARDFAVVWVKAWMQCNAGLNEVKRFSLKGAAPSRGQEHEVPWKAPEGLDLGPSQFGHPFSIRATHLSGKVPGST